MQHLNKKTLVVGSRDSPLAKAQVGEVERELQKFHPNIFFEPLYVKTGGDLDQKTSLKTLEKSNFFTDTIDAMQLKGQCRITIHSAKDLPEPLATGLKCVALTKGVDGSDSLVTKESYDLYTLPFGSRIGTSSLRREETLRKYRPDLRFVDIRGSIEERLALLSSGKIDGVVIAEAALIRLQLTSLNRIILSGETAPLQGRLAVIVREEDEEMETLFACLATGSEDMINL